MSSSIRNSHRRALVSAIALAVAVAAGGSAYLYLGSVQNRAFHNAQMTTAFVVAAPIAQGTSGAQLLSSGLIKQSQVPREFLPSDAVVDLASVSGELVNTDLAPGQILSSGFFTGSPVATGVVAAIPKDDVAITVSVDPVHGVAGLIAPGNEVDILVDIGNNSEQFLYQNVEVLAVGSAVARLRGSPALDPAGTSATGSSGSDLVTFAVAPGAAERIALAASNAGNVTGPLYLALVPPGNEATPAAAVEAKNLIPATLSAN